MKVVYVYADSKNEWNCSQWNCIIPANAVNRTGIHKAETMYIDEFATCNENVRAKCKDADIIIVERNYFGDVLTTMQFWKVRGKTILCIFDDAYDLIHPGNVTYNFWANSQLKVKTEEGKEKMTKLIIPALEQFKWGLRIAKGIQVPSEYLAKDWSEYGKTYHVNNFLDMDLYKNVEPLYPHEEGTILIGWCGSMSHYSSFTDSGIIGALSKISKRYPNVKVLISGDKRVFDELPVKNKVFQPFVPKEQWYPLLKSLDVGLAPLSGEYDKRRSWIKGLEYMALKVPWIGSKYPTYKELKDYGLMTENGYDNWVHTLDEMVKNYQFYKEKAEKESYEFALSQSSDNNIQKVTLSLYEKLLNEPYP